MDEQTKKEKLKKEAEALKIKSKEENIKRHQKRLEYKKELYLEKLKAEKQTFDQVKKLKNEVI